MSSSVDRSTAEAHEDIDQFSSQDTTVFHSAKKNDPAERANNRSNVKLTTSVSTSSNKLEGNQLADKLHRLRSGRGCNVDSLLQTSQSTAIPKRNPLPPPGSCCSTAKPQPAPSIRPQQSLQSIHSVQSIQSIQSVQSVQDKSKTKSKTPDGNTVELSKYKYTGSSTIRNVKPKKETERHELVDLIGDDEIQTEQHHQLLFGDALDIVSVSFGLLWSRADGMGQVLTIRTGEFLKKIRFQVLDKKGQTADEDVAYDNIDSWWYVSDHFITPWTCS